MKLLHYTPLLSLLLLQACSTTGGGDSSSSARIVWPKPSGKVIKISNTITFSGTKDYANATVDGSGLSGNGDQSENQESPFYLKRNSTLKNVTAKSWPESVSIREGNTTLQNVNIPDVGEDAVSTYKNHSTKNVKILNSRFAKAEDKIIQLNEGTGDVLIKDCEFDGFKSSIRIKSGVGNVTIENCDFYSGKRAIVLDPGVTKPKIINCRIYNGVVLLYQE